jgi:hypothetical protein
MLVVTSDHDPPASTAESFRAETILRDSGFATVRAEGMRRLYAMSAQPLAEVDAGLEQFRGGLGASPRRAGHTDRARQARAKDAAEALTAGIWVDDIPRPPADRAARALRREPIFHSNGTGPRYYGIVSTSRGSVYNAEDVAHARLST